MKEQKNLTAPRGATTRRQIIAGASVVLGGLSLGGLDVLAAVEDGISHTAESIHQEPILKASRERVYAALTDAAQFHRVTLLSQAMKSGMPPSAKATEIERQEGGAFALFAGYVTGRHIEVVPNRRLVQAWRAGSWALGVYSIVRFELIALGSDTKIVFDHTGFPVGEAQHLAEGWKDNYWKPLATFLSQPQA
jgi:activator of HSP90 ATPase